MKRILIPLLIALGSIGLTACGDDEIIDDSNPPVEEDEDNLSPRLSVSDQLETIVVTRSNGEQMECVVYDKAFDDEYGNEGYGFFGISCNWFESLGEDN